MVMSRGSAASQWACCVYLLVLLEFLQFSVGSGISSLSTEPGQMLPVDDASIVSADQHKCNTISLPKLDQVQNINQEDYVHPRVLGGPRSMLNSIRKCIVGIISRHTQFGPDGNPSPMQNVVVETESTQYNDNDDNDSGEEKVVGLDTSRRLLVRTRPFRSGSSTISHNLLWSLKRHEQQRRAGLGDQAMEGRRMMTDTSTESTQEFFLGPPAPASLVHNDKDGWSQDYAEPDVHPPSSN